MISDKFCHSWNERLNLTWHFDFRLLIISCDILSKDFSSTWKNKFLPSELSKCLDFFMSRIFYMINGFDRRKIIIAFLNGKCKPNARNTAIDVSFFLRGSRLFLFKRDLGLRSVRGVGGNICHAPSQLVPSWYVSSVRVNNHSTHLKVADE